MSTLGLSVLFSLGLLPLLGAASTTDSISHLLLRRPTVSATQIAFGYGGDLWTVDRAGGDARRLTAGVGIEIAPFFSPDGSLIAFTGEYGGNEDVYVVPAPGGTASADHPSRLRPAGRLDARRQARALPVRAQQLLPLRSTSARARRTSCSTTSATSTSRRTPRRPSTWTGWCGCGYSQP